MSAIGPDLEEFLESIVKEKLENFDVTVHERNQKGEGVLGEFSFVSLKHKNDDKEWNLAIKKILPSDKDSTKYLMSSSFHNEIHYYNKIFPEFKKFQLSYPDVEVFDNYTKCYGVCSDEQLQKIAMENMKLLHYEMHPKQQPLNQEMYEEIFKVYAHFHAISFAMRHHDLKKFKELVAPLRNNWINLLDTNEMLTENIKYTFRKIKEPVDTEISVTVGKKIEKYIDECKDIFQKSVVYRGEKSCLLHGDCHSNNTMIKYDLTRKIEHIVFIDFQIGQAGSPAMDLSYSFYSGADKLALDNLDSLLQTYHKTLSEDLRKYGCDPDKLYSFATLKQDWKDYCKFGFITGVLIWSSKCIKNFSDMPAITEIMDGKKGLAAMHKKTFSIDEEMFKKRTLDLIRHLNENDLL